MWNISVWSVPSRWYPIHINVKVVKILALSKYLSSGKSFCTMTKVAPRIRQRKGVVGVVVKKGIYHWILKYHSDLKIIWWGIHLEWGLRHILFNLYLTSDLDVSPSWYALISIILVCSSDAWKNGNEIGEVNEQYYSLLPSWHFLPSCES